MLMNIVSHTPGWVWALLAGLLVLGVLQSRTRRLAPWQLLALPLALLGLGVSRMAGSFAAQPLSLAAWALAFGLALQASRHRPAQAGTVWEPSSRRLTVPGSWVPMTFIVCIFVLRYGTSIALALAPDWATAPVVVVTLGAIFGALSGGLLGRGLALLRLTRTEAGAAGAAAA